MLGVHSPYSQSTPTNWTSSLLVFFYDDFFALSFREGCSMPDIWDVEDPKNTGRPSCCGTLFRKVENDSPMKPFRLLFTNDDYTVLRV